MALSRSRPRSESRPSTAPTSSEPPIMPITGSMPSTSAPAAPVKPSSEMACTAKLAPRVTTNVPMAPLSDGDDAAGQQRRVHEVLAQSSREHQRGPCGHGRGECAVVVGRADHDDPATDAQHVDGGVVEPRERLGLQHLVRRPHRPPARRQVEHAVGDAQDRVHVVGHEDDRRARVAAAAVEQVDDRPLRRQVEREQRLVGQEQGRVGDERLGDPQALLLAAGEPPHRELGVRGRADGRKRACNALVGRPRVQSEAPPVAVQAEPDEVATAHRRIAVKRALLGDVPDLRPGRGRRPAR